MVSPEQLAIAKAATADMIARTAGTIGQLPPGPASAAKVIDETARAIIAGCTDIEFVATIAACAIYAGAVFALETGAEA